MKFNYDKLKNNCIREGITGLKNGLKGEN